AAAPEILDTSTARVLDKAWRLGLLRAEDAEVLRPAVRLYHDLTQVLRLCLPGPFDPRAAAPGLVGLLARAADVPHFPTRAGPPGPRGGPGGARPWSASLAPRCDAATGRQAAFSARPPQARHATCPCCGCRVLRRAPANKSRQGAAIGCDRVRRR